MPHQATEVVLGGSICLYWLTLPRPQNEILLPVTGRGDAGGTADILGRPYHGGFTLRRLSPAKLSRFVRTHDE